MLLFWLPLKMVAMLVVSLFGAFWIIWNGEKDTRMKFCKKMLTNSKMSFLFYSIKYGLYQVDFNNPNRTRTIKQSGKFYHDLIKNRIL